MKYSLNLSFNQNLQYSHSLQELFLFAALSEARVTPVYNPLSWCARVLAEEKSLFIHWL